MVTRTTRTAFNVGFNTRISAHYVKQIFVNNNRHKNKNMGICRYIGIMMNKESHYHWKMMRNLVIVTNPHLPLLMMIIIIFRYIRREITIEVVRIGAEVGIGWPILILGQ